MSIALNSSASWRLVEVGRVVLISEGADKDSTAVIAQIIDHNRVLVDGPSVKRQDIKLQNVILTPIVLSIQRAARTGVINAAWEKAEIEKKWQESAWAQKRAQRVRRRALTDFERFKVLRLRKQARFEVRKSLAKAKSAAK